MQYAPTNAFRTLRLCAFARDNSIFHLDLLSRLAVQPLDEAACLDLAQQPAVDELARVDGALLDWFRSPAVIPSFIASRSAVRNPLEGRGIDSMGFLQHRPVAGLGIFADHGHGEIGVGFKSMRRFDMRFE